MSNRKAAIEIVGRLQHEGFQALLAGGCVRDMLLDRPAKDYDVATDARPEQVMGLFPRTIKVGAKFGVVIVLTRGQQVEVATFRTESGYDDGRHPTTVTFSSAAEDASRRDFTINGMFYDPRSEQVIDYEHFVASFYRVRVHLYPVGPVLELVLLGHFVRRELPGLPYEDYPLPHLVRQD